jgi:hypothetical protein
MMFWNSLDGCSFLSGRVKRLFFTLKKSAAVTTADEDADKMNLYFYRTCTFRNDSFAFACLCCLLRQGIMRYHTHLDFGQMHFKRVAACKRTRAWFGAVTICGLCLCYPVGGLLVEQKEQG